MIAALFLSLLPWHSALPSALDLQVPVAAQDPEVDAKIAAAGKDIAKLLELAKSYLASAQEDAAKKVFRRVLELDANNEAAHKGLRHQFYDKKWFESFAELSKYKREEAGRMKAKGLARFKDEWVPEAELPFLNMGWSKDEKGAYRNPVALARAQQIAEWQAAGYEFRADDNSWIGPDDKDKWAALLWKCGNEWVEMAKANEYHAKPEHSWVLAGQHFDVETTIDWEGGNLARWHADKIWPELVRIFGVESASKPHVVVLSSLEQYNLVAGNTPLLPEFEGYSSLHGAYFADLYFDEQAKPPQFLGCGVSYWVRKDAKGEIWGPLWLRWAAAQSYVDSIDPSWGAIGDRIAGSGTVEGAAFSAAFWSEKKIPRWLRYGAASYVERFERDPLAAEGADPWALRAFAFGEVKKSGGLRKLDDVFSFGLDIKDIPGSSRLYDEAGLVVAYLLDGAAGDKEVADLRQALEAAQEAEKKADKKTDKKADVARATAALKLALDGVALHKDVREKHDAFKAALKGGKRADIAAAATALQSVLVKHDKDIRKFAGL